MWNIGTHFRKQKESVITWPKKTNVVDYLVVAGGGGGSNDGGGGGSCNGR